jgi:hypothetical protein
MNQNPNIANQNPNRDRSGGILPSQNSGHSVDPKQFNEQNHWAGMWKASEGVTPDFMEDRDQGSQPEREITLD